MGAFASVPDDCLDKASDWFAKEDFLCQRAVSPLAREAARRGVRRKIVPSPHPRKARRLPGYDQNARVVRFSSAATGLGPFSPSPWEMTAPPRAVEAMGRVFGPGCTNLSACGVSVQSIAALYSFVTSTKGGLLTLNLRNCAVSPDALFLMCRASPNLLCLRGPRFVSTPDAAIAAIGEACPKLQNVEFSTLGSSLGPMERWGRVFPQLQSLEVCPENHEDYQPTRLHDIAEAARISSAVELDVEGCIITTEFIAAIVGTPVGDRLTQFGHGYRDTVVEPEALLAAARGFPSLTELCIPQGMTIPSPRFVEDLARSRNFESIYISADGVTNAHVLACLRNNSLKKLELIWCHDITRDLLDDMISTQAATLEKLNITYCAEGSPHDDDLNRPHGITFSALLRLVRACPKLTHIQWQHEETARNIGLEDVEKNNKMLEILRGRGGEFHHEWR